MPAIYHTHPATLARPSAEDIRPALTRGVVYVIVSLQNADNPVVKGFVIEDGNPLSKHGTSVTEVPVKIVKWQADGTRVGEEK